jgi:BRCA1/BRCA2-containing complex subunit 3
VEIAPESLHLAAVEAEEFGKKTGVPMMVIGWVSNRIFGRMKNKD